MNIARHYLDGVQIRMTRTTEQPAAPPTPDTNSRFCMSGFTLLELMIVIAIVGTLTAIVVPVVTAYTSNVRSNAAIEDLRMIQGEIIVFQVGYGRLPKDLSEMNLDKIKDPWGNPYQYNNLSLVPKGKWRKDKFLVPINSGFDLWSMGPDGRSVPPLTAKHSRDDIIRANDGRYFGKAAAY